MLDPRDREAMINDFALRSFRDIADQDYIAARAMCRLELWTQFHWSALQAVEKYLKAILLLHRIEARDVRHNLQRAMELAQELPFQIQLSEPSVAMLHHLDRFGEMRYLEGSFVVYGPKLLELDRLVWEVRRYCRRINSDGREGNLMEARLREAREAEARPHRFRLHNGFLEKVIDRPDHPAREQLLWQNLYFGTRYRSQVSVPAPFHATNAPLTLHPEILDDVLKYVYLPRSAVEAYREHLKQQQKG